MRMKMWLFVVLLSSCLPPSLSQVNSLVQVMPKKGDPICLGGSLQYRCTVNDTVLIWKYNGRETQAAKHFLSTDTASVNRDFQLGPFNIVLVNITFCNMSTCVLTSTASINNGLTADINGNSISCMGSISFSQSRTISFTVPKITNVGFCMRTISWSSQSCDANCTVSVDGQEIGTVPCKNGKLRTSHSDLSNKVVMITSNDSLGNVRYTFTMLILEDCSGFPISATTEESIGSPAFVGQSASEIAIAVVVLYAFVTAAMAFVGALIYSRSRLLKNGGKWKKKAIDDSDSATSSLGKIQRWKCILIASTCILALSIVVDIFAYTQFHHYENDSDFGLKLCDEMTLKVTGPGPHNISWKYGFHLIVPYNAVLEGATIDVAVKTFLPRGDKFKLPENFHLVSAVYEVSSSENFKKNVSIQIQHYAVMSSDEEIADYAFVKGRHSGTNDPYTFEILDGAFSPHSQLATISLNHSCKLGCVASSTRPTKKYQYAAHAYQRYNPAQLATLELQFFLTPYQRVYEKILDDEYTGWNKSVRPFNIYFKNESITLDFNTSTKVETQTPLKIKKKDVDELCEGGIKAIPSSKVLVRLEEEQGVNLQPRCINVSLLGAKPPQNFFILNAPSESVKAIPQVSPTLSTLLAPSTQPEPGQKRNAATTVVVLLGAVVIAVVTAVVTLIYFWFRLPKNGKIV